MIDWGNYLRNGVKNNLLVLVWNGARKSLQELVVRYDFYECSFYERCNLRLAVRRSVAFYVLRRLDLVVDLDTRRNNVYFYAFDLSDRYYHRRCSDYLIPHRKQQNHKQYF
jgi:hypothetical protein